MAITPTLTRPTTVSISTRSLVSGAMFRMPAAILARGQSI
jgi:hypothetical protein